MIKKISIYNFYENKEPLVLPFEENLTILTGDNGAGKTTILNLIFNILNGDLHNLFKDKFSKIKLDLDSPINNPKKYIKSIEITKSSYGDLEVVYIGNLNKHHIKITKRHFFFPHSYSYMKEEFENEEVEEWFDTRQHAPSFDELTEMNEELRYIKNLRKSLLYFPTYRRIDADILELIEQNYELTNDIDVHELKRKIEKYPMKNRIVGVNEDDINSLFKTYSNESRKLNSDGLDRVLRQFIKSLIEMTTIPEKLAQVKENRSKKEIERELNRYKSAPDQLIDLSKNFGIGTVDETAIREYFSKLESQAKLSNNEKSEVEFKEIFKDSEDSTDNTLKELIEFLFINLVTSTRNSNLIMKLIDIYDSHVKSLGKKRILFENLEKSFNQFFKGRIKITFNEYNLNLSKEFEILSTGEKQLITILAYTVLGISKSNYKSLIIIDEPELSLHISWQLNLIKNLLNLSDGNFIFATHSPYIANHMYSDYIWQIGEIDEY